MSQESSRPIKFNSGAPVELDAPVTANEEVTIASSLTVQNGASVDMGTNKINNVGTPTSAADAATKNYVDTAVGGGGATWGGIVGDIQDQVDLQDEFATKADVGAGTYLVSGGGVAWDGNLDFTVATALYHVNGVAYTSPETNVTLDPADVTDDRIDVIAVDDSSSVVVITGTPGSPPSPPYVDPGSQLQLTFIYVAANATTPGGASTEDIYLENAEWTMAANTGNIDTASTNNPHSGTLCVEGTNTFQGNLFSATKPSGTLVLSEWQSLVLFIRSKASWNNHRAISIFWSNGTTPVGGTVGLNNGAYGFDSSITSAYQVIVIPSSAFAAGATPVNMLTFRVGGSGGTIGWYIDDVFLQTSNGGSTTGGDFSTNTSTSVTNEIVLFADTTGKLGKRSTGTGVAHLASGVLSASNVNLASEVTGNLAASHLNSGTGATSLTFWRGDETWASPPGVSGAALTKTDDTNVTLTLGGSPSTALVTAASITAGWTGTLAVARGGTNAATAAAHTYFGNNTSGTAAPGFNQIAYSELSGTPTIPTDISGASFITKVSEGSLSNEFALGSLATGLLKNTTTTGVPTIATAGVDYTNAAFKIVAVSGQSDVVADDPADTVTLVAGTGVTLTTNAGADSITINSTATGAPTDAHYVTTQAESGLSNESNLGALTTGLLKHTVTGSVSTPATAVAGTDYADSSFKTIAVSGQSDVVADSAADTLTLAAGSNITLTTNASTDTITITGAAGDGLTHTTSRVASDFTTTSSTQVDITGLTFSAAANTQYEIDFLLRGQCGDSNGCKFNLSHTGSGVTGGYLVEGPSASTSTFAGSTNVPNTEISTTFWVGSPGYVWGKGIVFATGAGTISVQVKKLTASNVTVYAASRLTVTQLTP